MGRPLHFRFSAVGLYIADTGTTNFGLAILFIILPHPRNEIAFESLNITPSCLKLFDRLYITDNHSRMLFNTVKRRGRRQPNTSRSLYLPCQAGPNERFRESFNAAFSTLTFVQDGMRKLAPLRKNPVSATWEVFCLLLVPLRRLLITFVCVRRGAREDPPGAHLRVPG